MNGGLCRRCDRPFIAGDPARKLTARGLDRECYEEAKGCGELGLYPRVNRPWSETAVEAEQMRTESPSMSWHSIAHALGITYEALAKARAHTGCARPAHPARRQGPRRPPAARGPQSPRPAYQFDLVDTDEL